MKKLIFVRHGKAEVIPNGISDYERSLTTKGKIICRLMAQKLKELDPSPGVFVTSPAFRALESALIFAGAFGIKPEKLLLHNNIYHKMDFTFLTEMLSDMGEDVDSVTLFGHNPSFSGIADSLCREGIDTMPKTSIIGISFDISTWKELRRKTGKIVYYLKPEIVL
jgi:phosphohistidine phosphatase